MMSEDLRKSYLVRAQALEDSLRRLINEIMQHLPPENRREFRQMLGDRIDLLFSGVEDAALFDPEDARWLRERKISRIQELSDQLISAKAEFERTRRALHRDGSDIDIEERREHTRQLLGELDAERES